MAGSISLSLSQQLDPDGKPLSGGKLYFYQSGTTTPQSAYKDSGLTLTHPNPIELLADGRVPAFYLADGTIKIRLADKDGNTVIAEDGLLVIGPSSGGGGGGSVDATTVLQTGDIKPRYSTGSHTGWVRANGRTIGSASSGGSERANSDAQSLFEFLWTANSSLTVSSGRGASANADWVANKTIALPDFRGRTLAALDDMGNTAAGRLTATYFGAAATTLGNTGGTESNTLTTAQIPSHTHNVTGTAATAGAHTHNVPIPIYNLDNNGGKIPDGDAGAQTGTFNATAASNGDHTHTVSGTTDNGTGGGGAHGNVPPTALVSIYIKL